MFAGGVATLSCVIEGITTSSVAATNNSPFALNQILTGTTGGIAAGATTVADVWNYLDPWLDEIVDFNLRV